MPDLGPAWRTRDNPWTFQFQGETVKVWAAAAGVSAAGPAIPSNPCWVISAHGCEIGAGEADPKATPDDVARIVAEAWPRLQLALGTRS